MSAETKNWLDLATANALSSEPEPPHTVMAVSEELGRLRETIARQRRSHRTLSGMVRRLAGGAGDNGHVQLQPHLPIARYPRHPSRVPSQVGNGWWPTDPVAPARPLQASLGHQGIGLVDRIEETVAVSVMGLRGEDLDRVVEAVAAEQLKAGTFKPVFLTDQPDFLPFVSRGYSFEYLSTYRDYLEPSGEAVRRARRQYLAQKWGIARTVAHDEMRGPDRNYPPLAALSKHNADMSRACHHDRFGWVIETLRIADSAERFDAAEGLATYLLTYFDTLDKAQLIPAARVICRKFIAFGELDQLRSFLFKNIAQVKKDDNLFTWFSAYCTADTAFLREFALLPSGKTNSYYISKRSAVAGDQAIPNLIGASDAGSPNSNLLLANHFAAHRDAALYKMFVNRVLAKLEGATLSKVVLGKGNILDHVTFEAPRVASDQNELVSVIMSAYQAEETVGYAARSILRQSHKNLELLICDDCSSDKTSIELEKLRVDPRVRLFRSNASQGTYGIRNGLIAEARGRHITFQDSDDFSFPDRIERQLGYLQSHGAAAVVGQWYRVTRGGEFVFSSDHAVARLAVVSLFAPREIFERFGPYRSSRIGADTEFYERLRMSIGTDAVRLMPTPLLFGLASATSLTRSPGIEATEDGYRAPARRAYATASARNRHMGGDLSDPTKIEETLRAHGIYMERSGVTALEKQE